MSVLKEKKSFFGRLGEKISDIFLFHADVDEDLMDELEEILITSDIGMGTTMKIMDELRSKIKTEHLVTPDMVKDGLAEIMTGMVDKGERCALSSALPLIIMVIGVNGGGKTTSIGKLAHMLKSQGKSVMLCAADTFRAAASEQLVIWGERNDINVVHHKEGADPSAVIFDAIQSMKAKNMDVLIVDTAGRLQNKSNLMNELAKMNKIIDREAAGIERETLLVLDATTGKNAISQAKEFGEVTDISGIILTKLDGTAKGGIAITVSDEYDMPIKFIGVGEKITDIIAFEPESFIGGIFNE
ncbi:MAG: signal recognition particle-docking protein FtsY [Clostridia bacterium]|nr:signal recognition particle-docking protein FtsY [Clostridia bacterium]